jgi:hypothetical protein
MMINRRNWNSGILTLNTQSRYWNNPLNKCKMSVFMGKRLATLVVLELGRIKIGREIG